MDLDQLVDLERRYQSMAIVIVSKSTTQFGRVELTVRVPSAFRFRVVRGVFPLNFPGVLKTFVTSLCIVSRASGAFKTNVQLS